MSTARILCALFFLIAGTVYAIIKFKAGHILGGLASVLTGILAATPPIFGFLETWESLCWKTGAGICTVLAILAVIYESSLADRCQQASQPSVFQLLADMAFDAGKYGLDPAEQKLATRGYMTCGMQLGLDTAKLTKDLMTALYLGPASTLSSDVVIDATSPSPNMSCMDYYRELRRSKPVLFRIVESDYPCLVVDNQNARN